MSLFPLFFSDRWDDLEYPHRLLDQNFGLELRPEQLLSPSALEVLAAPSRERRLRFPRSYYRPWGDLMRKGEGGFSTIKADKDKFQVTLDVQQFNPEEINVKVVDKCVVVEAKHEEKQDEHGWISRQFVRKYLVPEQCNIEEVSSELSSDGVLTITAPKIERAKPEGERAIKIEHTGKPAIREKRQKDEKKEEKKEEKMDDKN